MARGTLSGFSNRSWVERLLGKGDDPPLLQLTLLYAARIRWLGIIGIWLPVYWLWVPGELVGAYCPEISNLIIWFGQIVLFAYAIANALVHWGSSGEPDEARRQLTYRANLVCIVCEAVSCSLIQYGVGCLAILQPTLGVGLMILYRIFCDYRSALLCGFMVLVGFVGFGFLETAQLIPVTPFFPEPLNHPYYLDKWAGLPQLWMSSMQVIGCFAMVNLVINEKDSLHRYMTEYVLQRYLPPGLVDRAARGELRLDGPPEEREVTVLFSDLVGFTSLSRELGADGIASLLDQYLGAVADATHELGGTVDKFIGDCVMVVFGTPEPMSLEEQVERAAQLAFQVEQLVGEVGGGLGLQARTGINTGSVVAGNFGSGARSDYTVLGHCVNVASRLESVGAPGKVLMGPDSVIHLSENWCKEPYGPLQLKGIEEPMTAYWIRPSDSPEDKKR